MGEFAVVVVLLARYWIRDLVASYFAEECMDVDCVWHCRDSLGIIMVVESDTWWCQNLDLCSTVS